LHDHRPGRGCAYSAGDRWRLDRPRCLSLAGTSRVHRTVNALEPRRVAIDAGGGGSFRAKPSRPRGALRQSMPPAWLSLQQPPFGCDLLRLGRSDGIGRLWSRLGRRAPERCGPPHGGCRALRRFMTGAIRLGPSVAVHAALLLERPAQSRCTIASPPAPAIARCTCIITAIPRAVLSAAKASRQRIIPERRCYSRGK
jgi:hypothetical protein